MKLLIAVVFAMTATVATYTGHVAAQSNVCVNRAAGHYCAPGFPSAIYACPNEKMIPCEEGQCVTGCDGFGQCHKLARANHATSLCKDRAMLTAGNFCHPELKGVLIKCPSNDAVECNRGTTCVTDDDDINGHGQCQSTSTSTTTEPKEETSKKPKQQQLPKQPSSLSMDKSSPVLATLPATLPLGGLASNGLPKPFDRLPSLLDNLPTIPLLSVKPKEEKSNLDDLTVPFLGDLSEDELLALPEGVRLSPRASYID
ncbi:hypothetical protein BDF19DRAFT_440902 [Syncephalis fuscata]|nr:hypothetical protein BDF19DRAFT_440902 [Syncephalis fuscata]